MSLLIGDNRECAKALTDLVLAGNRPTEEKKADRQVEPTQTAYIFGHYDSRGGAALVIADNHIEAMKKYAAAFFDVDVESKDAENKEYVDGMINAVEDDFLKRVQLVVCDEKLPEESVDLDIAYNEEGFLYGCVESRYEQVEYDHSKPDAQGRGTRIHTGKYSEWSETSVFVMWKPSKETDTSEDEEDEDGSLPAHDAPQIQMPGGFLEYEYRVKRESLGEDACGLVLIR